MAAAGAGYPDRSSGSGQTFARANGQPGGAGTTSLLGSATTWPLKRYGRFLPPADGDDDEGRSGTSWKVFESNEESGHLILTIVVSGHFFISQGRAVLEGFSLIDSHKWLKIVRRADCLLFGQNECRMFRVQFGGESKEQMLEHCCNCVQKLAEYVPVQVTDEQSQMLYQSLSQLAHGENQVKDSEQNASLLHTHAPGEHTHYFLEFLPINTTPLFLLLQSVLKSKFELPLVYRHSVWSAQELGPFIRLCLMDQNFPAFVEDVEKELKKLTEG
uniref:REC114 meiotic recombination protein n=1 Tax=Apteryx owenii TaxID=8824 RepID=A0A8B9NTC8_APTOW